MPVEGKMEKSATALWDEIEKRHRRLFTPGRNEEMFSPESLHLIDRIFQDPDEKLAGGILCFERKEGTVASNKVRNWRISQIVAYVGEVVRRNVPDCNWEDTDTRYPYLSFHDGKITALPVELIEEQLEEYKPGSVAKWGREYGLKIGQPPSAVS